MANYSRAISQLFIDTVINNQLKILKGRTLGDTTGKLTCHKNNGRMGPPKFVVGGVGPRRFRVGGMSPCCGVGCEMVPREAGFCGSRGGLSQIFPVADSRGLFAFNSAAGVPSVCGRTDQIRSGAGLFRGGLFCSTRKVNLADSAAYLIGPTWTQAESAAK